MGVTPAMPSGCSMNMLMDRMPDRAFDVGIAEGHAVTFLRRYGKRRITALLQHLFLVYAAGLR